MKLFMSLFLIIFCTKCFGTTPFLSAMEENGIMLEEVETDPLVHFWGERKEYFQNNKGNIFVLFVDVDGNGWKDYLISDSLLRSPNLDQKWFIYVRHNAKFWLVRGELIKTITFDYTKTFVGFLDEIGKWGIIHYSSTDSKRGRVFTTNIELVDKSETLIANITSQRMLRNYQNKQWDGPGKDSAMNTLVTRYFLNRSSNLECLKIFSVDKSWMPPEKAVSLCGTQ